MTSVKEFRVADPATPDQLGRGTFVFTDAYSVFDWGKMPDTIPGKGAALCTMGALNFERLEAAGVPTHYRGVGSGADVRSLPAVETPPTEMAIDLAVVPDLPNDGRTYDYEAYHAEAGRAYLVPLEIVFRNQVPVGSSLRDRTTPADHGLDYADWPDEPIALADPIVEFSTKFEESDRYLDRDAADAIAGGVTIDALESVAREVNRLVTEQANRADIVHQDGKIECIAVDGEARVADVVGTFDENRFSYCRTQLSKEVLRQYHKRTQSDWVNAVKTAKAAAKRKDIANWRTLCDIDPRPLSSDVTDLAASMYQAGTNAYIDRELFEAPSLDSVIEEIERL